jgi:hypothetical protein
MVGFGVIKTHISLNSQTKNYVKIYQNEIFINFNSKLALQKWGQRY